MGAAPKNLKLLVFSGQLQLAHWLRCPLNAERVTAQTLGFHHVAIAAHDVENVAAFYRDLLGLPELARYHRDDAAKSLRAIWLGVDGSGDPTHGFFAVEAVAERAPAQPSVGYSMVALRIAPEARARLERAFAARGVAIERQTGWTFYVRDPEGNLVGLSHHPHERSAGVR